MKRPLAVFRCDASPAIGGGHVVRCMSLAERLRRRGWHTAFAVGSETARTVPRLFDVADEVLTLDRDRLLRPEAMRDAFEGGCGLLVVDHYALGAEFEAACRGWARRIAVIDDLADRHHDADVLIDQTLGRNALEYAALVPPGCQVLAGTAYALLRPAFARVRPRALLRRSKTDRLRRVLVAMGSTDPGNATGRALQGLAVCGPDIRVDVILGAAAPHLKAVLAQAARMPQRVRVRVDVDDMAALMADVDLAIGAGGTTSWERCCLGLPTIMVATADNQWPTVRALSKAGAGLSLGVEADLTPDAIAAAVIGLAADPQGRMAISRAAARCCDGLGANRVEIALAPERDRIGAAVTLRPATMDDAERMLGWQTHPTTRTFAFDPRPPSRDGHYQWLERRLADPDCVFSLIACDRQPAGVLRLDRVGDGANGTPCDGFEVSIVVAPERHQRGIGGAALALARRLVPDASLLARIHPDNEASRALFAAAGYAPVGDGFVQPPAVGVTNFIGPAIAATQQREPQQVAL